MAARDGIVDARVQQQIREREADRASRRNIRGAQDRIDRDKRRNIRGVQDRIV